MKASHFFISTLKEKPTDAEIISHQLMIRSGMISKVAAGIYNYMPLGLRSIRKVEKIIREEMVAAGAIELLMPAVQPAELWKESERWKQYGPELLRLVDRHKNDFVIGPTHEEVITDIARNQFKSYRQMPITFFQIQNKFRDEIRPRFGIMRGREFMMKDAYSFDCDEDGLKKSYEKMYHAYQNIFTRLGLQFRAVLADNGAIGGSGSQEFHVIAQTGEDAIAYCPHSDYAANIETAQALPIIKERALPQQNFEKTLTPGQAKCEAVAEFLKCPLEKTIKSIVLAVDFSEDNQNDVKGSKAGNKVNDKSVDKKEIWLLLLRGDHTLNEIKTRKLSGLADFRFATEDEIVEYFGTKPGYLGPIKTKKSVNIIADTTVENMSDFVCGANEADYHFTGVNWTRDLPEATVADIRNVVEGDASPDGKGHLALCRGIEVGHIFRLGTKYSESMNASYKDKLGQDQYIHMGCYGIGVTRILGAAIEQNFDDAGIIWPTSIAPFEVVICPIGYSKNEAVKKESDALYDALRLANVDVILDDREGKRPGEMFADWDLIGVPHRLVISEKLLINESPSAEYKHRQAQDKEFLPLAAVMEIIRKKINNS